MALSKKQGIAIGVGAVAVAAIVGGIVWGVNQNQPAEAAAAPEKTEESANVTTDEIQWVRLDEPVAEAVEALEASGFEPVEPGKLTVAHSAYVPPLGYIPEGETEAAGTEPNIGALIADALGLEYNPVVVAWADWPLGIQSGKYDLITSNVTVTEERKELYDFASYREDLLGFYVKSDSDIQKIEEAADISGLTIAVGSGTNQEQVLLTWNEELQAGGEEPAELQYFDDNAATVLALQSGRIDATFGPNATSAWSARETGDTKLVGLVPGGWPLTANIAAATAKGNGLIEPVSIALNYLIENGQYDEVLKIWDLESERVETSEINPAGLPKS
ncbi:ABC transporter substrate-binding protein [Microbacterium sp. LMI12-1-1.1]|jgi:polar amino acid transport system substrate-binding protein|uniref:ABC transporter substrate-binding protein n=1 Tax=Microbacterium sp. LWS13-1.2 TaxID=3135264 RepID=A0AAU6SA48_9MICO